MGPLPATQRHTLSRDQLEVLIDALERGESPKVLSQRLHPTNKKYQRVARRRLEAAMLTEPLVGTELSNRAKILLMMGLGPAIEALNRRAARGNVLAIKLLLEASGFHNPRVQHEHSGEITVKLDLPRPKFVDAEASEAEATDAEVVE